MAARVLANIQVTELLLGRINKLQCKIYNIQHIDRFRLWARALCLKPSTSMNNVLSIQVDVDVVGSGMNHEKRYLLPSAGKGPKI